MFNKSLFEEGCIIMSMEIRTQKSNVGVVLFGSIVVCLILGIITYLIG